MNDKLTYGIVFDAEIIDDRNILLKPYHIVEGNLTVDGNLMDKYESIYNKIYSTLHIEAYKNLFGFGIKADELQAYFKSKGYPTSQTEHPEICANYYLEFSKRYAFILEHRKKEETPVCYAINLYTKNSIRVDLEKNVMEQLMDDLTKARKTLNNGSNIKKKEDNIVLYNPKVLLQKVKQRVVGQDEAAFQLVTTICKNLKYGNFEGIKTNILLYGPTGCGKTELARSLAKELNLPFIIEDVSNYTANGYVGDSVKKILRRLYVESGKDMERAQRGIVFLDEFDKLAPSSPSDTIHKTDVQEELLKIIEGTQIDLNDSNRNQEPLIMDTSNITFILGGAFAKIQENRKRTLGFESDNSEKEIVSKVDNSEFVKSGIISEMVGRIQVKLPIRKLSAEDLEQVLEKSSISCLKVYEEAFLSEDKVKLVYENKKEFISKVAMNASKLEVGARGLKTVVDEMFIPAINEISSSEPSERELIISSKTVDDPNNYVLRKVKREVYELPKRVGEKNN